MVMFYKTFGKYGLPPEAMKPGYGLAESTVYVSDGGRVLLRANKERLEHDGVVEALQTLDVLDICRNPDAVGACPAA